MADIFGTQVNLGSIEKINVTGFISSTWWWILIIAVIGIIFLVILGLILYYKTYNCQAIVFRHGLTRGIEKKTRMRSVLLKHSGLSVFKLLFSADFVPSDSLPMYARTYWFERGKDGYLRNFVLNPDNSIKYIHNEMRLFDEAISKQAKEDYATGDKWAKAIAYFVIFVFLLTFIIGMWVVSGKFIDAAEQMGKSAEANQKTMEVAERILEMNGALNENGGSGIIPAT